jgi:hypothetical protein
MGRPIYSHELEDNDFKWLINSFKERRPNYVCVEASCLPVVLIEQAHTSLIEQADVNESSLLDFNELSPDSVTPAVIDGKPQD